MSIPRQKKDRVFIDPDQKRPVKLPSGEVIQIDGGYNPPLFELGFAIGMLIFGIRFVTTHGLTYPSLYQIFLGFLMCILCAGISVFSFELYRSFTK